MIKVVLTFITVMITIRITTTMAITISTHWPPLYAFFRDNSLVHRGNHMCVTVPVEKSAGYRIKWFVPSHNAGHKRCAYYPRCTLQGSLSPKNVWWSVHRDSWFLRTKNRLSFWCLFHAMSSLQFPCGTKIYVFIGFLYAFIWVSK